MIQKDILFLLNNAANRKEQVGYQGVIISQQLAAEAYNLLSNIVLCKDCKYGKEKSYDCIICTHDIYEGIEHKPNWFCADGININRK